MSTIFNFLKKNFTFIIIIVLIGVVVIQRSCGPNIPIENPNIVTLDKEEYELLLYKKDTFWKTETITIKGDPIPGKPIPYPVPVDVDTTAILADYFKKIPYTDVIKIKTDSIDYGTVTVIDTVQRNRLFGRTLEFNLRIPEIKETVVLKGLPKRELYYGGGINFDKTNIFNSAYGGLLLKTKKEHIYGLNVGITNQFGADLKFFVGGSMYWKFDWKREKTIYSPMNKRAAQLILDNL